MVAEKLDQTVGQLCFCRIFQTVRNLQKGTTEISSEGPKMVQMRYGSTKFAVAATFANLIQVRPAAVGREILSAAASRRPPPPWSARVK